MLLCPNRPENSRALESFQQLASQPPTFPTMSYATLGAEFWGARFTRFRRTPTPRLEEGLAHRALETHRDTALKRVSKRFPLRGWLFKTCHLQKGPFKLQGRSFPKRRPASRALLATRPRLARAPEIPGQNHNFCDSLISMLLGLFLEPGQLG